MTHEIVSANEWLEARKRLLVREKEFTRMSDALAEARRELPWVRVTKPYRFDGPYGEVSLGELFARRSQLIVYHFMFAPDWTQGCKSCSFWADNFERNVVHLAHRDATMVAISRAPREKLAAYQARIGWTFPWYSSERTDFNSDYGVSFDASRGPQTYNYVPARSGMVEMPGISVFYRDREGAIFHTYSTFARGIEPMNAAYHFLDLLPKGRDEGGRGMSWLQRRDEYDAG